jgi:hypothetical protein
MRTETQNQRFFLNGEHYIIDKLNPANNCEGHHFGGEPDDARLRECVLRRRLSDALDDLIRNNNPMRTLPNGKQYQPPCDESWSLWWPLFMMIKASHLETLPVELSIQHRFNGDLNRKTLGLQGSTSLSLFVDDVERLLRDLYGEANIGALDRVRSAVFVIVEKFTQHICKDLWKEHTDAIAMDYACGIGVPEDCAITGSDFGRAQSAARDLGDRVRAVRADPSAFGKYTVEFVRKVRDEWLKLDAAADPPKESMDEAPF